MIYKWLLTCKTKSLPLKSAIVRGRRVLPQTKRRKSDRSGTSMQYIYNIEHIPLYVATDFNKLSGMSGLPQTIVSSSAPLNSANRGTGTTFDKPSRTAAT
ncbi:hypothetical protein ALC53_00536 [Atta colombica]|uniref:Uncharacterized protein n=1 Tax=Atta colombica TaxID=520822 RepID=A0A195BWN8_9HYME|nr:hypothetical protein ALC53_00536 [Atta colombica]